MVKEDIILRMPVDRSSTDTCLRRRALRRAWWKGVPLNLYRTGEDTPVLPYWHQ